MNTVAGLWPREDPPLSSARSAGRISSNGCEIVYFHPKLAIFKEEASRKIMYFHPKSNIFVQNRRFSNKKWAAKSRIFVQNRRFSNKKWAAKSRIFVQNRRFSNKKWAAKSRIFIQNRRFSKKKWAANLQRTSYWKSDDFVDFQIRSEKLQNHNKEMGYRRTHGRTPDGQIRFF